MPTLTPRVARHRSTGTVPPRAAARSRPIAPPSPVAPPASSTPEAGRAPARPPRIALKRRTPAHVATVVTLVVSVGVAPAAPAVADDEVQVFSTVTQSLTVDADADRPGLARVDPDASPGVESLVASGTNADWATLVLLYGGFPITEANVTVILRWMRQENYPPSWWNRNNPLNNGYGSGGGSGLGSYDNLQVAAQMAAENLRHGLYDGIVEALEYGRSADRTAQAIWASPWASSHYAGGAHWSTAPVEIVTAPATAWGPVG